MLPPATIKELSGHWLTGHWSLATGLTNQCDGDEDDQYSGGFSSKMANIDSKYDSFIHFTIKFNSISISSGICNSKNYSITFFSLYI